jgi:hypothetical protein
MIGDKNSQPKNSQEDEKTTVLDPKNPPFIPGTIQSITGSEIVFMSAGQSRTAEINRNTKFTKQSNNGDAATIIPAQPSEFAAGADIIVFFSEPPKNNVYSAHTIQLVIPN